jgi:FMN reductase
MNPLIISCSIHPQSRSRILAEILKNELPKADYVNMREYPLPLCDGKTAYDNPFVPVLKEKVKNASGIILAVPVYNYNLNAVMKNLVELLGDSWTNKPVAFMCTAGGSSSYLAPLGIMNSLMLDFRCFILPRYVYATASDFNEERTKLVNNKIKERVVQLKDEFLVFSTALKGITFS